MNIKGWRLFIIISLILISNPAGLRACSLDNSTGKSDLLTIQTSQTGPGMREIYGVVEAISATEVTVDTGKGKYKLPFAAQVGIFCNGLPAVWQALRPVTAEAFFEAELELNQRQEIVFIAGQYCGEVCVLKCWHRENDHLFLKLAAIDSGQTVWRMVARNAKVPDTTSLEEDSEIYVLYNRLWNIRAVFLPD